MQLFKTFIETLDAAGVFANERKMVDARWTKKNNTTFYRYQNYVKADTKTKFIEEYGASVHDSQAMEQLLTEKNEEQQLYADSAYTGEDQEAVYKKKKE